MPAAQEVQISIAEVIEVAFFAFLDWKSRKKLEKYAFYCKFQSKNSFF